MGVGYTVYVKEIDLTKSIDLNVNVAWQTSIFANCMYVISFFFLHSKFVLLFAPFQDKFVVSSDL